MGAFISKQPNGLYCRFSTIVDTITHYNMTESDYIEFCIGRYGEKGRADAEDILKNHIVLFEEVLNSFIPNNETVKGFNKILKKMGYDKKFINTTTYEKEK